MSSDDWPDWLPADWTVQINKIDQKKVKCYIDSYGHKCYSKPQVFDYLRKMGRSIPNENTDNGNGSTVDLPMGENPPNTNEMPESSYGRPLAKLTPRTSRRKFNPTGESSYGDGYISEPLSSERHHGDSSWLPDGWTVEVRSRQGGSRSGMKYKRYTDPISGQKFFSKPQVLNHLVKTNRSVNVQNLGTESVSPTPISTWESPGGEKEGFPEPIIVNPISSWRDNSTTDPDEIEATEVEKNNTEKNSESVRFSSDINGSVTELNTNGSGIDNPKPIRSISGGNFSTPNTIPSTYGGIFTSKEDYAEWLPDGWVVEVRYKTSGQKYKIFTETATGKKLYSKPTVLSYLGISSSNSRNRAEHSFSIDKKSTTKKGFSKKNSDYEEVITTCPADGLPTGWIKEIRTKIYATHKRNDPFYIDPVAGYIFRSKLDALRFLDHGDVNLCAIRPKVKVKDGNEVPVYTNAVQKPADTTNGKQIFEGENSVENPTTKRQKVVDSATKENTAVEEKPGSGVNLETEPDDDGRLCYDIPEDDENWTDQCIDFAVKTLSSDIMFNGQPAPPSSDAAAVPGAGNPGVGPTGGIETHTKVN